MGPAHPGFVYVLKHSKDAGEVLSQGVILLSLFSPRYSAAFSLQL